MAGNNLRKEKRDADYQIVEAIGLVRKVVEHGFGEVVIKVQNGRIVMLQERLTYLPAKHAEK